MTTIKSLKQQIARIKRAERSAAMKMALQGELKNLKFNQRHKKLGSIRKSVSGFASGFQKQRKSGTGVGGWLQRVANNQRL